MNLIFKTIILASSLVTLAANAGGPKKTAAALGMSGLVVGYVVGKSTMQNQGNMTPNHYHPRPSLSKFFKPKPRDNSDSNPPAEG
ncbi:MAG: hypothetical protein AB7F19_06730 [Candidatus Babeliales bacterium]